MDYLTWEDVFLINKMTVRRHGGQFVPPDNLLNPDRLKYALEAVSQEIFGERLHSSISEVAAAYMFYIVTGHVFQDGNKRTGLEAALLFLGLNDAALADPLQMCEDEEEQTIPRSSSEGNQILYQLTIELAAGRLTIEQLKKWFAANTRSKTGKTD